MVNEYYREDVFDKAVEQVLAPLFVKALDTQKKNVKEGEAQKYLSFREALTSDARRDTSYGKQFNRAVVPLKNLATPRMEGGNIIVEVDEEDYKCMVEELRFSMIGRLIIKKVRLL